MATDLKQNEPKLAMEIRTKSVEQTLIPLVNQITTLVNAKERAVKSEKTVKALARVGQAVSLAVERFVAVGEAIALENADIRGDMCQACAEARLAGTNIQKLTEPGTASCEERSSLADRTTMVRAARQLLSAITKVLVLADKVVVKQCIAAKDKVRQSLERIERCSTFTDFVKLFSQFGNEMVELAHLSGDRQNDLKSERARAQIGAARAILEKSTMMLLTTSKAFLRHPDCRSARESRDHVFTLMRKALDTIHQVITDGSALGGEISPSAAANGDSGISLAQPQPTAFRAIKEFEDLTDLTRVTLLSESVEAKLTVAMDTVVETTQDFTDSAYTTHDNRERILGLCGKVRGEAQRLVRVGTQIESLDDAESAGRLENAILKAREACKHLRKQLVDSAMDQASDVFKTNEDHSLLAALKQAGLQGNAERVAELAAKFHEHSEQIQEVCKLLRHISGTDPLVIWSDHAEHITKSFAPQVVNAATTLCAFPTSKIAKENLKVFADAWASHINDLSVLVKDVSDVCQGMPDRTVYLSLPRPGKHGTTAKNLPASRLNAEEQAKMAKLGLEMKLITSEMDAETEKWDEVDNEIVRRAKNMSSMAFSMYLFTRGEGPLNNTQDLFTQAQYFAEEGGKLYQCTHEFAKQLPQSPQRVEVLNLLERLPPLCQRLVATIKAPTVGKIATFTKVDNAIQETKNLMNSVSKVVTASLVAAAKFGISYPPAPPNTAALRWRPLPGDVTHLSDSDRESVQSARLPRVGAGASAGAVGRRPDPVRRSASLNSSGTTYTDRI